MTKKTSNKEYLEAMLKGRMAESLVEELLKGSGNKVYRFGYESIAQNLVQLEEAFDDETEVGQKIRSIPDFIVMNRKGIPEFVEVKFRWNGEPSKDDRQRFEKIAKFWNAPIILVNCKERPYFHVMLPPYFGKDGKFVLMPIEKVKEWNVDKKLYESSEELVGKYLGATMVRSKLIGPVHKFDQS